MSQSQKSLKVMEEETNQLVEATKSLSEKATKTIDNINKNIESKLNQMKKEKQDALTSLEEKEKQLSHVTKELNELKNQKTALLQENREKDLKIDELQSKVKDLEKKLAQ